MALPIKEEKVIQQIDVPDVPIDVTTPLDPVFIFKSEELNLEYKKFIPFVWAFIIYKCITALK